MMRLRVRIIIGSALYELVWISDHLASRVFEYSAYRVHREHKPRSSVTGSRLYRRIWIQLQHTQIHTHIFILIQVHTHRV